MKMRKKFITAAELNFTPGFYLYGDGVKPNYGRKMSQLKEGRLKWIHKELIDAYIKACSIDENNFNSNGRINLDLLKKNMLDLIDSVTEIKRRRGII